MLKKLLPFLNWFPSSRSVLRADFFAGLTVALVLIPQSMAYADLAGLPPWVGLYAAFLPVVIGGLWGSSNHLQTGPVAMIGLLTASALGSVAAEGSQAYIGLASALAFMVGTLWLFFAYFRLSFVINFLSRPVVEGFVHAAAIIIATSQLGALLGIHVERGEHYLTDLVKMFRLFGEINWTSCGLGGGALLLLLIGRRYFPKWPMALLVVAVSSLLVCQLGLSDPMVTERPLAIVGEIPRGVPGFVWAVPSWRDLVHLLPGALTIAFVGFMEMCSVARALAVRSRQKLNLNQEMYGQALASFSSAFTGGFPVSGSFSRSALNYVSGARSGMSSVFTGAFVMIFLLVCSDWLYYLPKAVLSAIIIAAVVRLLNFGQLWHFMVVNRADGIAAFGCFFATLLMAPHLEQGIVFGASISILIHLYRLMHPHVALLGLHPDGAMRDAEAHNLKTDPNLPAIRLDGRLFFANAAYFEEIVHHTCDEHPQARYLVVVCDAINGIDASGTEMLKELTAYLREKGVQLLFVGVKSNVFKVMHRSGLDKMVGRENMFGTFERARKAVYERLPSDMNYTI